MMAMPHCESVPLLLTVTEQSLDRNLIDKNNNNKNKILKNIYLDIVLYSVARVY